MIKRNPKVKVFFTMSKELNIEFEKYIEDNLIDKSKLLEKLIENYISDNKKK